MIKKFFAAIIAVIVAVIMYFGGWEIIKFIGSDIFRQPWTSGDIVFLAFITLALICGSVTLLVLVYHKVLDKIDK